VRSVGKNGICLSSMMAMVAVILFFSCSNDMKNVIQVSELEKLPLLSGDSICFVQKEYGKIVLSITTPKILKRKAEGSDQEDVMEFPDGVVVVQYSSYPDTLSMISTNYAINYESQNVWEARGNVVAKNVQKQECLQTEFLIWDQKKGTISSNKKVQVTSPDDIIIGEGFVSDDQFTDWQVQKVTGVITFENENILEAEIEE